MDLNLLLAVAILLLLAFIAVALAARQRHSGHLAHRFGPEHGRRVERTGGRGDAGTRGQRTPAPEAVPIAPQEAQRLRLAWQVLQARFVDSPRNAMAEADLLVRELMTRLGYRMADFESRSAGLSKDHPVVVEHYRAAHAIALRDGTGEADTESLRQAVVHYRALFDELLDLAAARPGSRRRTP